MLLAARQSNAQPSAGITSKAVRGEVIKPPPFPYRTTKYSWWRSWIDKTSPRMDENSKIIVVDGPPTAGKATVAKGIADMLGFLYVPAASLDMVYINPYGHDFRSMKELMPRRAQPYDINDFHKDPKDDRHAMMQLLMYEIRYNQYVDTLAHLFNTGQGLVLDTCVYGDRVHVEAGVKNGYLSKNFRYGYGELSHITLRELKKPHLIVYLDVPVPEIEKRLKAHSDPAMKNSKALTTPYLKDLEHFYKYQYLKDLEENCHVLVYDWSDAKEAGDYEGIVEDIERLEFEEHEKHEYDPKMKDWYFPVEEVWCEARHKYTMQKATLLSYFNIAPAWVNCPEVWFSPDEGDAFRNAWEKLPGSTYDPGFNKDQGDTGLLFKNAPSWRRFGEFWGEKEWWIPER